MMLNPISASGAHKQCQQRCNRIPSMNGTRIRSIGILESIDDCIVKGEARIERGCTKGDYSSMVQMS